MDEHIRMSVAKQSLFHFTSGNAEWLVHLAYRYPACGWVYLKNLKISFLPLEELSLLTLQIFFFLGDCLNFKPKVSQEGLDLQSHFSIIILV